MDVAIAFFVGIFIGSAAGIFTFALLAAAKMEDDMIEHWDQNYPEREGRSRTHAQETVCHGGVPVFLGYVLCGFS